MSDDNAKAAAAEFGRKASGEKVLRGHHAVDPKGHLVLLPPGVDLPGPGWRWATQGDHEAAAAAEEARRKDEAAAALRETQPTTGRGPIK
jgi:hypothetical protein